jgi:hypothetical protein
VCSQLDAETKKRRTGEKTSHHVPVSPSPRLSGSWVIQNLARSTQRILTHINEMTLDGCGGRHNRADQMRSPSLTLTPFEVPV